MCVLERERERECVCVHVFPQVSRVLLVCIDLQKEGIERQWLLPESLGSWVTPALQRPDGNSTDRGRRGEEEPHKHPHLHCRTFHRMDTPFHGHTVSETHTTSSTCLIC